MSVFRIAVFMTRERGGEFEQLYGPIDGLATEDFVERLYLNALDMVPEDAGFDFRTEAMDAGLPGENAVFSFSKSPEYRGNNDGLI